MRRLFYFPLEPYKERYTCQLSAPKKGWLEWRWNEIGLDYVRVEGRSLNKEITVGSVLDATGRGYWACSQIMEFLRLLNDGQVESSDCLYFDDFWHPGVSALPYAFYLMNVHPKLYAMLHAQSVDQFDFTYPMRYWMRHFEKGMGEVFSGIFVTSTCLRDLCLYFGVGNKENIHLCGLPYNSDEVRTHFPGVRPLKKRQVIFSSRWDQEKCPDFFLRVVDSVLAQDKSVVFLITTSAKKLRSNSSFYLNLLNEYLIKYPLNLFLKEDLSKEEYYYNLLGSKVQFNCADQDFVSWTLLEATTCGCNPVYPYFLSFPEALNFDHRYLYVKGDVESAARTIFENLDREEDCSWIYKRFDHSWERMLAVMKGRDYESLYSG